MLYVPFAWRRGSGRLGPGDGAETGVQGGLGDVVGVVGEGLEPDTQDHLQNLLLAIAGMEEGVQVRLSRPAARDDHGAGEAAQGLQLAVGDRRAVARSEEHTSE